GHQRRRAAEQRAVPVHDPGDRRRRGRHVGAAPRGRAGATAAGRRRQQRPPGPRPRGDAHRRSRHRVPPRLDAAGDRRRALRRVRTAPGRGHLRPADPVPRRDGGRAALLAAARHAARPVRPLEHRRRGPAGGDRSLRALALHAVREPPGPVPGGDDFLQPRAGRRARRGGECRRAGRAPDRDAAVRARQLPGDGAGVSRVARERAAAHPGGARHGLHRARGALRELHPSDHDPLDASVRRRRRAPGADDLPHGPERDGDHRHAAPDRHRQEERDHDDRLRARRRAARGEDAGGGDLRGVPAALPADHDDDDGGAARGAAARDRRRRRLGAPAAARDHDRRRPDREPGPHALHHAGHLPRVRPPRAPRARPPSASAPRGGGGGRVVKSMPPIASGVPPAATRALLACALALASACTVGPDYVRPSAPEPAEYKNAGDWKVAQPRDDVLRGPWWDVFGDPVLSSLEEQVDVSNQSLRAAEARFRQAQTLVAQARAGAYPTATVGVSLGRSRQSENLFGNLGGSGRTVSDFSTPVGISWEPDLWGRVRRLVESNEAGAQASAADLAAARLSLHANVAVNYFQIRTVDAQKEVLRETIAAYEKSLQLTRNRHDAGIASGADVAQAETQLETTRAQEIDLQATRAALEDAIAVLIGVPASDFSIAEAPLAGTPPAIPPGVPSEILERRPDVAAAERRIAAANAEIGVALAAYYPSVVLSASGGF